MCVVLLWTHARSALISMFEQKLRGRWRFRLCASSLQKDADRAVVVAVTSHAVFESGPEDGDDVYGVGVASPLLQVKLVFCPCM